MCIFMQKIWGFLTDKNSLGDIWPFVTLLLAFLVFVMIGVVGLIQQYVLSIVFIILIYLTFRFGDLPAQKDKNKDQETNLFQGGAIALLKTKNSPIQELTASATGLTAHLYLITVAIIGLMSFQILRSSECLPLLTSTMWSIGASVLALFCAKFWTLWRVRKSPLENRHKLKFSLWILVAVMFICFPFICDLFPWLCNWLEIDLSRWWVWVVYVPLDNQPLTCSLVSEATQGS